MTDQLLLSPHLILLIFQNLLRRVRPKCNLTNVVMPKIFKTFEMRFEFIVRDIDKYYLFGRDINLGYLLFPVYFM